MIYAYIIIFITVIIKTIVSNSTTRIYVRTANSFLNKIHLKSINPMRFSHCVLVHFVCRSLYVSVYRQQFVYVYSVHYIHVCVAGRRFACLIVVVCMYILWHTRRYSCCKVIDHYNG